jgi:thymidylate kinase
VILVIEGLDGAGKTTLATALAVWASERGKPTWYCHNGASLDPLGDYVAQMHEALQFHRDTKGLAILDRYNLGEQVYPYTRRDGKPLVSELSDDLLVQIGAQLGFKWLVLVPPALEMYERLVNQGEEPDKAQLMRERALFGAVANRHRNVYPDSFKMVTGTKTTDELVELVLGWD